ncbi:glutaredoxin family protein [Ramlibacter rhizophilus]|uniref:Glutaredoxin family protein n=1 Tax=Ramlibacter rhizophilus TaxID=1781167 RepID=A0A4Z0BY70_9BURK|nr:glutaredoxin family protein [Ramlibacter rhizophilus]TFZ03248.1 glutaredoxin family protein [Ramlibacter rhizophilus]
MSLLRSLSALATLALAVPMAVQAQGVYRSVTPDGRVVFTDRPAAEAAHSPVIPGAGAAGANPALPFALRQVAGKFPVVLYAAPNCAPCDSGRALLATRGIPYSERTVSSQSDIQALQRLTGGRDLPLLAIGAQHIKGFSGSEWNQYLDAAGYPRTSALPAGWKPAPAQALAGSTVEAAASPSAPSAAATGPEAPAATASRPATPHSAPRSGGGSNPAGIQF